MLYYFGSASFALNFRMQLMEYIWGISDKSVLIDPLCVSSRQSLMKRTTDNTNAYSDIFDGIDLDNCTTWEVCHSLFIS